MDSNSTRSDEEDEDDTVKTTELEKKIDNDNAPDLLFQDRHEKEAQTPSTAINNSNENENPPQITKEPCFVYADTKNCYNLLEKKKKLRRLNLAQKCINKKPNK
uniref:(northern house mosquito) hypothetical protein n=1 Tax=Culex pipiens TaxID=7175 RepID=A0A8D8N8W4_CULPI